MNSPLWQPSTKLIESNHLYKFIEFINEHESLLMTTYEDLYDYSLEHTAQFWSLFWDYSKIIGHKGSDPYIVPGEHIWQTEFFPQAKLSYAENLLNSDRAGPALIFSGEDKVKNSLDWSELRNRVSQLQQALIDHGLKAGDVVAGIMPNMPQTVIAMLAVTSLGAVWSSCSPDFGAKGILDRFSQINPKFLFACDGYYYNGKSFDLSEKIEEVVENLPNLTSVIVTPYLGTVSEIVSKINIAVSYEQLLEAYLPKEISFPKFPFSHPLFIMFSSGTTGVPKCIIHTAGGTLIQHKKEHLLHCDIKAGERIFYFTTCGWMMWNWLVSVLASEATLLLYDGSPFASTKTILFDFAQQEKCNLFGTSAKYIDALKKYELTPGKSHDLSSIRMICSTGSTLSHESYEYVYSSIKNNVHLVSMSGGTDIISCFLVGNPMKPVWIGQLQSPGLALEMDVLDEDGNSCANGVKGELVCKNSIPCMPLGFANDPGNEKYINAYFSRYENIWHHGDYAEKTLQGGYIIHGRSDTTLNPGGVRIGTAEIYRQVEQVEEIKEALVTSQDWDSDVRVVLFIVLQNKNQISDELIQKIKSIIRKGASPRHVPEIIIQVQDIPRTKSGKITELAVREVIHGRDVKNIEALANPETLEYFKDLAELAEA